MPIPTPKDLGGMLIKRKPQVKKTYIPHPVSNQLMCVHTPPEVFGSIELAHDDSRITDVPLFTIVEVGPDVKRFEVGQVVWMNGPVQRMPGSLLGLDRDYHQFEEHLVTTRFDVVDKARGEA
jgi:hypothetical protein